MAMVVDVVVTRSDSNTRCIDKLDMFMKGIGYTLKAARKFDETEEMRTYFGGEVIDDMHDKVETLSDKYSKIEVRSYQTALR